MLVWRKTYNVFGGTLNPTLHTLLLNVEEHKADWYWYALQLLLLVGLQSILPEDMSASRQDWRCDKDVADSCQVTRCHREQYGNDFVIILN